MRAASKCLDMWPSVICLFNALEARRDGAPDQLRPGSGRRAACDDLLQAAGELEVAERIRRKPFEIVVLVVEDRLPGRSSARRTT